MKISNLFKGYNIFLTGIFLYQVGYLLFWGIEMAALKPLVYVGPLLFIFGLIKYAKDINFRPVSPLYRILLIAFVVMWIRFDIDGSNGGTVQDITGCGATILFLIMPYNPYKFKLDSIIKYTTALGIIGAIFSFVFYDKLLAANAYSDMSYASNEKGATMSMAAVYCLINSSFFLCLFRNISTKVRNISVVLLVMSVMVAMIAGRRGYSVIGMIFLAEFFFLFIVLDKKKPFIWKIAIVAAIFYGAYQYYLGNAETQFQMFTSRLDTDSRTGVFYYWEKTMNEDTWNWIIGKGVSGGYWDGGFGFMRPNIENGLRNCLLKGGLLYLIPYMGLSIQACYLAFFRSKSSFMRGLSIYIFTLLVFMFVWGTPSMSFFHLNLWIAYMWIFNRKIRNMTDDEINATLYNKNTKLI